MCVSLSVSCLCVCGTTLCAFLFLQKKSLAHLDFADGVWVGGLVLKADEINYARF